MMCGRLSRYDALLERLAQDFEDMAAELGQFIQEEDAIMGQRHFTRHRHMAPTDQPRIRDGVMGGAAWAGRDPRRAVTSEAGDAVDAGGLNGFGEGHGRQDGGDAARQHRLTRPSAILTVWLCKGVCQFTLIVGTDPLHEVRHGEHASGFHDGPFPMHPLGLNRIEPGTLAR
jgi:hypothetical protein